MACKLELRTAKDLIEVLDRASSFLESLGKEVYSAKWLLREKYGIQVLDLALNERMLSEDQLLTFEEDLLALADDYPAQYIAGHTWFYGRRFQLTEDVLIPRPETEEIVDLILKRIDQPDLKVWDIGTGSGVIALSLKAERPTWKVWASDVSANALDVARSNARALDVDVDFALGDLGQAVSGQRFDLIVSNPPYISKAEVGQMSASSLKFEPELALFADQDGLAVYQSLASELPDFLTADASVFLEIGYKQGPQVKDIMQKAFPQARIELLQDLAGHDRCVYLDL